MADAGSGAVYNFAALKALWNAAGGSAGWADTMAAIALAESSGCRYALAGPRDVRPVKTCTYRSTTGENSVGLWQINVEAHPQYSVQSLFDPMANARAAVAVLGSGTPTPWSTYTNGAYRTYLPRAGPAGPQGPVGVPRTQFPPGVVGPVRAPRDANAISAWHHLARALGSTVPTQARRARLASHRFTKAIR